MNVQSEQRVDVAIIIGSKSDQRSVESSGMLAVLDKCHLSWQVCVISAHRHPTELTQYCNDRLATGTLVFIGVGGMSAALPGAIAAQVGDMRPVIGVALSADGLLGGLDALLSMVRMPAGTPVAVTGIDKAGLYNAAKLAAQIIAINGVEIERSEEDNVTQGLMLLHEEERYAKPSEIPAQPQKPTN